MERRFEIWYNEPICKKRKDADLTCLIMRKLKKPLKYSVGF